MRRFRYAGLAEESSYGVAPTPAAAFHLDIASSTLDPPTEPQIIFEGGLSRGTRTHRPGYYAPEGNVVYPIDIVTIGWLLKWTLGAYSFTADTPGVGQNTHELHGLENSLLPSFATRIGKDAFEHVFSGCVAGSLALAAADALVEATMAVTAQRDARADLVDEGDLLLPDGYPLVFHEVTTRIAGVDEQAKVKALNLEIANNPDAAAGRSLGSRHPRRVPVNARDVTLGMTLWYEDLDDLVRFWGDPDGPAALGSTEYELEVDFDAGTDGSLNLSFPRVINQAAPRQPSGRDEITPEVAVRALIGEVELADASTVRSELLGTLINSEGEMVA